MSRLVDLRWSQVPRLPGCRASAAGGAPHARASAERLRAAVSQGSLLDLSARRLLASRPLPEALEGHDAAELAGAARGFLEAALAAWGGGELPAGLPPGLPPELEAPCAVLREALRFRAAARAVREFVGGLLYLVLASAPGEEDALAWATRPRLAGFVGALCGGGAAGECPVPAGSCCPRCSLSHIAVQEALSLVSHARGFLRGGGSGAGEVSPHFEDGLLHLLGVLRELLGGLHAECHAAACAPGSALNWRGLCSDLLRTGAGADEWQLLLTAPVVASMLGEVRARVAALDAAAAAPAAGARRGAPRRAAPGAGFARFPPALLLEGAAAKECRAEAPTRLAA